MKNIILISVVPFLFSCYGDKVSKLKSVDLKIADGGFIGDTGTLKRILYPTDINGNPTEYHKYAGKLLKVELVNHLESTIYLYSKSIYRWPIDSLQTPSIQVDSAFANGKYMSLFNKDSIYERFDTFNDSILPGKMKEKLLYINIPCEKLKGKLFYGLKDSMQDFIFESREFILSIPKQREY